jgi:ABC-type dipeptide/oligopeptide/nickel transport system permease subunit
MAQNSRSTASASRAPKAFGDGYLFGIPVGDLGWFASLLMAVASGFAAFFASTFCAIFAILFWNGLTHANIDFALSYRAVGLPAGLTVLVAALGLLGTLWVRRMLRKA